MYSNSPARIKLLQQARGHYSAADDLARDEEFSVGRSSRRSSTASYSAYSISSRATTSTAMSSPTGSLYNAVTPSPCSPSHCSPSPSRASSTSSKKYVTFLDLDDDDVLDFQEPIIRPDSPTLGLDDWTSSSSLPDPGVILMPKSPNHEEISQNLRGLLIPQSPFDRYTSLLMDIRVQAASHIAAVDSNSEPLQSPDISDPPRNEEQMRGNLHERIKRLRSIGWKRQRFDAGRYDELCDSVMAEL